MVICGVVSEGMKNCISRGAGCARRGIGRRTGVGKGIHVTKIERLKTTVEAARPRRSEGWVRDNNRISVEVLWL